MLPLNRLLCDAAETPTSDGVWQVFESTVEELGFSNLFYCSGVPKRSEGGLRSKMAHGYMMGTLVADSWPEAVLHGPDTFENDFISDHCKRDLRPLCWSNELRDLPPRTRPGAFELAMDCGCHSGLTIPIHGADGRTFGNLSFFHDGSLKELGELTRAHLPDLQAAALYTHTMLLARRHAENGIIISGDADPALAPRERDCLLRLARGDRTMQIADRLTLSEPTVNEYIRNAKRKLDSRTRAEAVAKAVLLGLIEP